MGNIINSNLCKMVTNYVNPYYYWTDTVNYSNDKNKNDLNENKEGKQITPLLQIIPKLLKEIDSGSLQNFIANIIISFMVATDLSSYLSVQLSLDYVIKHLTIYDFQENEYRKKLKNVRAFIVKNVSFKADKIEVQSPIFEESQNYENIKDKLPDRYNKIISQNKQSKYIQLRRFKKIPKHIFWWKKIEDAFKSYFTKKFDYNPEIGRFIECNGISELRKHGILHNCIVAPPLYDTNNFDQKWYIEFWAVCTNIEPRGNKNSFPYFVIENADKLMFEIKCVTYSNEKNLGLHMPTYD